VSRAVRIGKQIARGLGAAHAAGIVHRDLKPDNVMLVTRGDDLDFVKILDFGIAKVGTQPTKITRAGSIFGTPHYMSPEQAAGTPVDARTDIYALGVILYEMVAGKVPFDADAVMGILSQHLHKAPTPLIQAAKARSDVPPSLEAVVMKCLAKTADARYPSMDALIDDLESVERGLTPIAMLEAPAPASTSFFEPPTGTSGVALAAAGEAPPRRSAWMIGVAGALAVAAVAGAVTLLARPSSHARDVALSPAMGDGVTVAATTTSPEAPASATAAIAAGPASPAAAPSKKLLVLKLEPGDARAFADGQDLGTSPVLVWLKSGEKRSITIKRVGYAPRTESFDGDSLTSEETKLSVKLTPLGRPATARPAAKAADKITDHDPDPWKRGM
jgi:serine/threonine-protein kinase